MAKQKNTYRITGRIIDAKTRSVAGLRVEAWDKDLICNDLVGSAVTDEQGKFHIEFARSHFQELFLDRKPDLFFKVYRGNKLIKSTKDTVFWNLKTGKKVIEIKVNLASKSSGQAEPNDSPSQITQVPLADVLEAAGVGSRMLESFRQKNISEAKDLFTAKGRKLVKEQGLTTSKQQKLLSTAKFAAASGSVELGKRLAQSGLTSLSRFSRMPRQRIEKMLGQMNKTDRQALHRLSYVARMVSNQTQEASIQYQRSLSRDGKWLSPPKAILIDREPPDYCGDGDPCFNVFSPIAYIFDLLNFIYDNWNIPSDTLEDLFHQEIDSLNCENGFQSVPQIYLAIDVLEKHLGRAKALSASEKSAFIYKGCIYTIMNLFGIDRKNFSDTARDNVSSSQPTREVLVNAINAIREEYRKIIKSANPLPSAPITNDPDDELKYLMAKKNIEQLWDRTMVEFENMSSTVFSPFLVTYRGELIKASGKRDDQLENWLFIDLRSAPTQVTNRITQVIQSLQSFVLTVRTGEIKEHPCPDVVALFDEEYEFDEVSWTWLSEYGTWSAAMYVLVYPENLVSSPINRGSATQGFLMAAGVLNSVMDEEKVQVTIDTYKEYIETIYRLELVGAHVIKETLYLFGNKHVEDDIYELWINEMDCVTETWHAWRKVSVWNSKYQAVQVKISHDQAFLIAARKVSNDNFTEKTFLLSRDLQTIENIKDSEVGDQLSLTRLYYNIYDVEMQTGYTYTFKVKQTKGNYSANFTVKIENFNNFNRYINPNLTYIVSIPYPGAVNKCKTYIILTTSKNNTFCTHLEYELEIENKIPISRHWKTIFDKIIWFSIADERAGTIPNDMRIYFEESYLHLPLLVAWKYNLVGNYVAAHNWYRTLYDPFKQQSSWYGIPYDVFFTEEFKRPEKWLANSPDPYAIAAQRKGVYLRHTILMMVKNLLDWADHEFARSGPESINNARELYLLAERILKAPELHNLCHIGLDDLWITITKALGIDIERDQDLYEIDSDEIIKTTKDIISNIIQKTNLSIIEKYQQTETAIANAVDKYREERTRMEIGEVYNDSNDLTEEIENVVLAKKASYISDEFQGGLALWEAPTTFTIAFPIPPNPLLKAFSFHIQANLAKIHANINIAGDWTPQIPNGDVLGNQYGPTPESRFIEPPRYRYSYLAEKARQQAGYAQQLGAALLQAIEKKDAAMLERLQAEHAIAVAEATVTLKDLMRTEAGDARLVADQQKTRANVQYDFWNGRIKQGSISETEMKGLSLMNLSGNLQLGAAIVYSLMIVPSAIAGGTGGIATAAGGIQNAGIGFVQGNVGMFLGGGHEAASALQAGAGAAGIFASLALTIASFQRRWEDWMLQYNLANIDQTIADLQVTLAQDRINIADQDKEIANLQRSHAVQVLNFLKTKDSNAELYQWMRDVLVQQYRIVMEIATSTALFAQRALEFERQEPIKIITDDYWSVDTSMLSAANLTDEQKSFGILGAERLLTALTQLDDNKLQKDRRHLQISKTISLARLMPTELIELRETGKIMFNTLMEWFDWDFPGHYLRLIKSVKVSVLALVSPIDGIHAMLSNDGVSSVVVNENGAFVKKRTLRTYDETIALDAAYNETGLFVFDYNDPMFFPFEGLGVETQWTFEMPKATNRFNFDTIADVLFTIEYTALHSKEYSAQVKTSLGNHSSACTYLDLRQMFPDQWYHVKNPQRKDDDNVDAQKIDFNLPPSLFPPNLTDISTVHVTMIVAGDLKGNDVYPTYSLMQDLVRGISLSKKDNNNNVVMCLVPTLSKDTYAVFATSTAGVVREFWQNVPGNAVSDIPLNRPPDNYEFLSSLEGSINQGKNYGSRIRGYLKAPVSGDYIFWLSSDDQGEFYLSTDRNPANKIKIASVSGWTYPREWKKNGETLQKSDRKTLKENEEYYFEVLHKEGSGGDNVAVGWLKPGEPGNTPSEVIPGSQLSLYSEHTIPSKLNPSGQWALNLASHLYNLYQSSGNGQDEQRTLIDRIENITIVLTVEGTVQWPS